MEVEAPENTSPTTPRKQALPEAMARVRWKPGQSGNPGGRPATLAEMRALLTKAGGVAIYCERLTELADNASGKIAPSVQLGALVELGNRLFGRPEQAVNVTGTVATDADLDQIRALRGALLAVMGRAVDTTATREAAEALGEADPAPALPVAPDAP